MSEASTKRITRVIIGVTTTVVVTWAVFAHFDGLAAWGLRCAFIALRPRRPLPADPEGSTE